MTKLTRSRAIWSRQMHQDVGQMHQGAERVHQSTGRGTNPDRGTKLSLTEAQGPDLIRALGAGPGLTEAQGPDLIKALGAGPGLTETGCTRLGVGVAHRPAGRGQALSQALGAQSGQLGMATLAQP
ncbi:hypothetical protein TanjilG_09087 [Lupinus angustifolius]|uniref:Uncharacterized protein n=1 Tax=Lupinus angustifolius TaxID=3871 RepID=A0A394DFD7_LUPAN|nr:hypothetical protein TanjilG_09087 [Lupinus angustifolius]